MTNSYSWPVGLPCPVLSSLSGDYDLGLSNSEMESGVLRQRRMFDHLPGTDRFTLRLSIMGGARLMAFAQTVAGASFDITIATPEDPFESHRAVSARFISKPSHSQINGQYRLYAFELHTEGFEPEYADDDDIWNTYDAYGDDALSVFLALEWLVNVTAPTTD